MEDEKVKQLAETLKNQGLAASMYEAIEKAKSILNVGPSESKETQQNAPKEGDRFSKQDYDVKNEEASVDELMEEVGVTQDEVQDQEKEKVSTIAAEIHNIKEEMKEAKNDPEKIEQIKEEISKVNEEVGEVTKELSETEEKTKEDKKDEKDDKFKEKGSIDLSEVFNYNK